MRQIDARKQRGATLALARSARGKKQVTAHRSLDTGGAELAERIVGARGRAVILDADLAAIYGVETRVLNQAVKRNEDRFPEDFAFRLSLEEAKELRSLRSQIVISKLGRGGRRYLPWAFTEHGAIMAASVLNSPLAVELSVFVVRAFVHLRDFARTHAQLAKQLAALERRVTSHDADLKQVFAALRQLLDAPARSPRRIGFGGEAG